MHHRAASNRMTVPPRRGILDVPPYPLAEPVVADGRPYIMLASNECAAEPGPLALAAFGSASEALRPYPDGSAAPLRHAIASQFGLDTRKIVCGNGSEELIGLLLLAYCNTESEVIHSRYGYLLFRTAARIVGAQPVAAEEPDMRVDVDSLLAAVTPRTRVVFVANPNNPTGFCLQRTEVERLRRGLRDDILLVLDAAYAEYAMSEDYDAGAALVDATDNTVMLRTFSKIHGLAGLRVGWCYAPTDVADVLHRVRPPTNISGIAQRVATAALQDQSRLALLRTQNAAERARFSGILRAQGATVYPSEGNFVLARLDDARRANELYTHLKAQRILVRPMTAYGLADCLRFTIGGPDTMDTVISAIQNRA